MSLAWVIGTGRSSSSGLYAPDSPVSVMSVDSESELESMMTSGSGTGTSGPWLYGRKNIRVLKMVLVLVIDAF